MTRPKHLLWLAIPIVYVKKYQTQLTNAGFQLQTYKYNQSNTSDGPFNATVTTSSLSHDSILTPKKTQSISRSNRKKKSLYHQGPQYIYECPLCNKKFNRKKMSSRLNKHKNKTGFQCPSRTGVFIGRR
ncbi:MAG: hypothetical protein WC627_06640 [Legionella sp.]|jgi:hypothetical protein